MAHHAGCMGMNSERLSARAKQPGHDRTFEFSEKNLVAVAKACLDPEKYEVIDHPKILASIFAGAEGERDLGVIPEAAVVSKATGRQFFIEVKKQGPNGNAEERGFKHHTVQFYKTLNLVFEYDYHPFITVWCESLASLPRYTRKAAFLMEPDQYFLWEGYDPEALCRYLSQRCAAWLDD